MKNHKWDAPCLLQRQFHWRRFVVAILTCNDIFTFWLSLDLVTTSFIFVAMQAPSKQRPQVIFLDAVGTLFGVRGSVGQVYASIAHRYGVNVDPEVVNQAFYHCFKTSRPMTFADVGAGAVPMFEYVWWEAIASQTFQLAGVLNQFKNFQAFFAELYRHFETADPWFVYTDVQESLDRWSEQGIDLGILSNFDTRIHKVLPALGLRDYFSSITISSEAGAAKPDPIIFKTALEKHNCPPELAWHVGDDYQEDYEGAKAVGMHAIWLKREN
jgi:putative hydrolase of the HAD superfamily